MLSALTGWLLNWGNTLLSKFYNLLIDCIQYLLDCLPIFITAILQLFSYACPPPPLPSIGSAGGSGSSAIYTESVSLFITTLNWLLPMQYLYYCVNFLVCAMTGYMAFMVIGRWLKVVT